MSRACAELEVLLSLRAAGALEPAEEAEVDAHLAGCPACRAEVARDAEVLGLARLAPPTDLERRVLADVPDRVASAARRSDARRSAWKRVAAVAGAVAALAIMITAPALVRRPAPRAPAPAAEARTEVAAQWQEPDVDTLWSDTDVLEVDSASAQATDGGSFADAVASLDDG